MESERIYTIVYTDKVSTAENPEHIWDLHLECAFKTAFHVYIEKDMKSVIERNKGNYMNFENEFYTVMEADWDFQHQHQNFITATMHYHPKSLHLLLHGIEKSEVIFKEDMLTLVKLFLAFNDGDPEAFDYMKVDLEAWQRLSMKYDLTKETLSDVVWCYPFLVLMVMRVLSAIERPIGTNMMYAYQDFKPEYRFIGLLAIIPKYGTYGGFVKLLLHHAVFQLMKAIEKQNRNAKMKKNSTDVLSDIIGLARVIYHNDLNHPSTREEFFTCMDITTNQLKQWTLTFNKEFPEFWDIHIKYFEQAE